MMTSMSNAPFHIRERLGELRRVIERHNHLYYVLDLLKYQITNMISSCASF